jgi:hypothetical protein
MVVADLLLSFSCPFEVRLQSDSRRLQHFCSHVAVDLQGFLQGQSREMDPKLVPDGFTR